MIIQCLPAVYYDSAYFSTNILQHQLCAKYCDILSGMQIQTQNCYLCPWAIGFIKEINCFRGIHWQKATIHIIYYFPSQQRKLIQTSHFLKKRCIYCFQGQHGETGLINFTFGDDEILSFVIAL